MDIFESIVFLASTPHKNNVSHYLSDLNFDLIYNYPVEVPESPLGHTSESLCLFFLFLFCHSICILNVFHEPFDAKV